MPYNGSGIFGLVSGNPVVTGTVISSTVQNNTLADIANGLTDCVTRDGQSPPTVNIPMGGFQITGLGNATTRGAAVNAGQIQDGGLVTLGSVAGTDTITASAVPAITAYVAGQTFDFIATGPNTTNVVTLNISSLGAIAVKKLGTLALVPGDMITGQSVRVRFDGTQFQVISPLTVSTQYTLRNKLINGRFDLWQRGTSFSAPTTGGYSADRWIAAAGTGGVASVSIGGVGPGDAFSQGRNFLSFAQTTAGSGPPNLNQRIESVRTSAGLLVTLTVVGKVVSGTLVISPTLVQIFGTGGSPSANVVTSMPSITLTVNEAAYSVSVLLPSLSGKTIGTNLDDSLQLSLSFPLGTTFTAFIISAQLEEGAATPFENRPFEIEYALCQRYTWALNETIGGVTNGASSGAAYVKFPVTMRAAPTYTNIGNGTLTDGVSFITMSGLGLLSATAGTGNMSISTASATVGGRGCTITGQTGLFSAEL